MTSGTASAARDRTRCSQWAAFDGAVGEHDDGRLAHAGRARPRAACRASSGEGAPAVGLVASPAPRVGDGVAGGHA